MFNPPIIPWNNSSATEQRSFCSRPAQGLEESRQDVVAKIIQQVKSEGDLALRAFSKKFDKVDLGEISVAQIEIKNALDLMSKADRAAIDLASVNIDKFHSAQVRKDLSMNIGSGTRLMRQSRPIEKVGLYVPGGSAPLVSTVMMLAIPAKIAGCQQRVLCTPPSSNGEIDPAILATAKITGITEIFKIGGAQAIAAMAYGTQSVPRVDKIYGPGNSWVTEAKVQVSIDSAGAACDMPAGPSEVLVIGDDLANPVFLAADLLSQAEHGADSHCVFIGTSKKICEQVREEVSRQLANLSRKDIATASLQHAVFAFVDDAVEAIKVSNQYAPEHLILQVENASSYVADIVHAGSVFLGPWTPEAVGDYASGTNHVLPTYGFARSYSGLSVDDFCKQITFQELSSAGIRELGPTVERLAALESLDAHKLAVTVRLDSLAGSTEVCQSAVKVTESEQLVTSLARPDISELNAYQSARSLNKNLDSYTLLDANESPYETFQTVGASADSQSDLMLRRYPDPQPEGIQKSLGDLYGVSAEKLFIGRGADDAIDALCRVFCRSEIDQIMITPPTYGFYRVSAEIQGAGTIEVPMVLNGDQFVLDIESMQAALSNTSENIKVVFLCSPGNPSGNLLPEDSVRKVLDICRDKAIVVVDEAYMEYAEPANKAAGGISSWVNRLDEYPNLVVLRTLSKAWGLAGARLGCAISNVDIINILHRVRAPYPVSTPTVQAVKKVLSAAEHPTGGGQIRSLIDDTISNRETLIEYLKKMDIVDQVFPSVTNFVLIRVNVDGIPEYLKTRGIVVRDFQSSAQISSCIRLTVGTELENQALIMALEDFAK